MSPSVARRPWLASAWAERGAEAPVRVQVYAAAVAVLAAVVAALAIVHVAGHGQVAAAHVAMFAVLIAVGECLPLRYLHRGQRDPISLVEGMFAPLIFRGSGVDLVIAVGAGLILACVALRRSFPASVLTVAQGVTAASAGLLAFNASDVTAGSGTTDAIALVGAMLAVWIVSQLLTVGARFVATGHPLGTTDAGAMWLALVGGWSSFAGSTVLGLLMTGAYVWVPWVSVLVLAPLALLWSAGRTTDALEVDRWLADTVQHVTHHLTASLDRSLALPAALAAIRTGFGAHEVTLVVHDDHGAYTTYRCSDDTGRLAIDAGVDALAERLIDELTGPSPLASDSTGRSPATEPVGLAAPLHANGTTFGVLILHGGAAAAAAGFEAKDLAAAGVIAAELVSFLDRSALIEVVSRERRVLGDIVHNTGDGIVSLDLNATILSWNAAMAALTGYSIDEMVGTRHFGLLRPRDADDADIRVVAWIEQFVAAGVPADLQIVTADGATVWLSCSFSRVEPKDGGSASLIMIARDSTRQHELEVLKDDFMAVFSHELRTPLVPIKGWANTLLTRGDLLSDDQRRAAVQSILSQAQRLESLVLNILESSRVEAGHSEALDVVDVTRLTTQVVDELLVALPDRVVRVTRPAEPCEVRGSAVWIERALANLVANAVKYSPEDCPVDIVVSTDFGTVAVSVTDRGPGISADAQSRIFERFERLEDPRRQAGTGLGLYITRQVARAMGGDVAVSSLPGAGSTFVLTLPALPVSTAARGSADPGDEASSADPPSNLMNLA